MGWICEINTSTGQTPGYLNAKKMDYLYFSRTLILILLKLKDDLELNAVQPKAN